MKRFCFVVLVVGSTLVSREASAQAMAPAAVTHRTLVAGTASKDSELESFGIRSSSGALGFVAGVAGGLALAAATGPHPCGCDDPGLSEAILGAAVGGIVGSAIGVSFPKLSQRCSFGARMLRSAAGSLVGTLAGTVISVNLGGGLIGWPIGAVLGASTALLGC